MKNIISYLEEAEEFLRRGDTIQASEKYYKAAEEAIKILSNRFRLVSVLEEVSKKGRWKAETLFKAARLLDSSLPGIFTMWKNAWKLHEDGFHEDSLDIEMVYELKRKVVDILLKYKDKLT
ncbi:PaREP1 family protein [Saccharolobus caldissimus]|uniref:PaREP1 family protein n=1 Tax=Saccharolobus caldissimus TaxID=1702097 RepID=A0AAQ4CRE6_9CREN|nr:PaREP1 family protein [Saccharolobus caldissimus]BDB98377.1 hypothetical protein SACC_13940 [Saccharolobus caldissimus]